MKTMKLVLIAVFIGLFFLCLPFLFFLNKQIAYYSYKEVVYRTIINNVVGAEKDPEKASLLLLDYCHKHVFSPYEAQVIDKDVYTDLVRGIA